MDRYYHSFDVEIWFLVALGMFIGRIGSFTGRSSFQSCLSIRLYKREACDHHPWCHCSVRDPPWTCSNMFTWDLLPPLDLFKLVHLDPTSQPVGKLVVSLRLNGLVVTARNSRCVYHSFCTQGGRSWQRRGCVVKGGVHARGHAWQRGMRGGGGVGGGRYVQERRPLKRAVRILLECILVSSCNLLYCIL